MPDYPDEPIIRLTFEEDEPRLPRVRKGLVILGVLFFLFLCFQNAVPLYTDWLWFGEVGYRNVFSATILAKTLLFCVSGLTFFALFYGNARRAHRSAPETAQQFLRQNFGSWGALIQRGFGWILLAVAVILSLGIARLSVENWAAWLEFTRWTPFGVKDPVFGLDIGFYVFRLPFLDAAWAFLFQSLLLTTLAVIVIYYVNSAVQTLSGLPQTAPRVRAHILALLGALALARAIGYRLDAYELLTRDNGVFHGAGFTDLHYRLFAYNALLVLLGLTALACFVAAWKNQGFKWPLIGAGAWLAGVLLLGGAVPGLMQKYSVEPNQFLKEQESIRRNIAFTRKAYNLENVRRVENFPADESLTAAGLRANRETLENVRLWDYPFLGKIYNQVQSIKTYYRFEQDNPYTSNTANIDIDRYVIGGKLRQVMLAPREIDPNNLPASARTWQNVRLGYTHGFGLVMSPVNKVVQGGPAYFLQGFPPVPSPEAAALDVAQPRVYYGMLANDYIFVDTKQQEFDYPSTEDAQGAGQDHYTTYDGRGGVRIGNSLLAKLAFSLRLGDVSALVSDTFTPRTRVMIRRDIRDRLRTLAPFVQQDSDPYLIVNTDDGRLIWMIDCYTMTDRYPYSTPVRMNVTPMASIAPNYIRNSIKATIDAYDGTVTLYQSDPNDPIARTYGKIYPGLLKPMAQMPAALRAHVRYPEDLFRLQRSIYATYHVDDPRVFYLREDAWAIPVEPNTGEGDVATAKQMEPYYVIMRLPAGTDGPGARMQEEFLLMSPMSPINRESQNILGWMCARCDGDRYGQLVLYRFPQRVAVNGPAQVISLINSDPVISSQLSLLRAGGSSATFGNLLVIPIEKSLLYITPLYIEASGSAAKLPQLQKVMVAFGQRLVLEDTLDKALARLFPGYGEESAPEPATPGGTPPPSGSAPSGSMPPAVRALIERAATQYEAAQQKLRAGDFAGYGSATKDLERTLSDLRRTVNR